MPSNAFVYHLEQLLRDPEELDDSHTELSSGSPGRQFGLAALNRAIVVTSVSAWESYVEEVVRESVLALRPIGPPFAAPWPALNAFVTARVNAFHTPSSYNVEQLLSTCLSLSNVQQFWKWQNCTPAQAIQRLTYALTYRHQIAHGVNPRPIIHNYYSSQLPNFFRRLARCTDVAIRDHLINMHGLASPWPL